MTEIILREDVENLGAAGDVVDVKAGYARNYLLPRGLALPATESNLRRLDEERRRIAHAAERERERAREQAAELDNRALTFRVRAGEEGRLYGSVTASDIADLLTEEGIRVERRLLELEEPIRELGVYDVPVKLHAEVRPTLKVWVVAEE